ncbi:TerB family tellurite resistance protein [Flavobacterium psychroterrae]|uniref:TerB family tellurite resistance protein n=1 Tax=Flavobacterium psychroterrae TaxID=2133767 RepID=A0ABS5PAR8_9FLAO|nr:TerB family tellurite resistance protein [Flavobacterium psychroterrae]MBS7230963.1 TerB family tellurite resistance protein [Flavobacterium psychroterrae]
MKRKFIVLLFLILLAVPHKSTAQSQEIQQLLLNIEKLSQFKEILKDMKKGYEILTKGYKSVKDMSEGNFTLHKTFLDALMQVSPVVRNYKRVGDIINNQILLLKESKTAWSRFSKSSSFKESELKYFEGIYGNITKESLRNLDDLTTILTADKLRMSDDERLEAIDQIYIQMQDKLEFIRSFNTTSSILALQRTKEAAEVNSVRELHSLKN